MRSLVESLNYKKGIVGTIFLVVYVGEILLLAVTRNIFLVSLFGIENHIKNFM